ncbi:helix-turn-helix domain-containing protein [Paraburkholderia sp. 1N]|uniref:Helix-turn-helix domain-containing protein n=1 Tax=Paraburkholderia solitsugae TaxID=2675748 RepID=A0ABX2BR97_9BURK|nr:helix-turn-helix domain-containing protein [Paraburkholderia solitsugae]
MALSPKTEVLEALHRNCLFRSDKHVEAHDYVTRELSDHVLRWKQGAPDVALFKGELNQLKIYELRYGAEVEVTPRPFDGFTLLHTSLSGCAEFECDGHVMSVAEGRTAMLAPRQHVRLRWMRGTQQLIVRIPNSLLQQVSGKAEDETISFMPGLVLPRQLGSQWDLLVQSLLNISSMSGDPGIRAEWRDHFERNLALFLALHQSALSTSQAALLPADSRSMRSDSSAHDGGIRQMDAMLEYIESRLHAPISLEDLARVAGVSFRTLNVMCHRYHGVTPMELLRNMRLDAVRARLLLDPAASVTDTALMFGFGHLGRFSAYYFARFNELPRDTQKKRQR